MGFDAPTDQIHKLTVEWSDKAGDYVYTLNKLNEFRNGERQSASSYQGDIEWAKRIAAHYGANVPEVEA